MAGKTGQMLGSLRVAREGMPMIAFAVIAAAWAQHLAADPLDAVPLWGLAAMLWALYRDPVRAVPSQPLGVVSPVDGRVVSVEEMRDPYRGEEARRVEMRLTWFGIRVLRSPIEGRVREVWLAARWRQGGRERRGFGIWVQSDEGDDVVLVVGGMGGFRPRARVNVGQRLGQGKRFGIVPLGARVVLYVGQPARIKIEPGTYARGGCDVVAELLHQDGQHSALRREEGR